MPYSSAAAIMTARDHPFNHSGRPLLAERKPQLLKKKFTSAGSKSAAPKNTAAEHRESLKVHGFNDFDIISQKHFNTHHIGYPYGSPPSPTAKSNDFVFCDDNERFYSTNTSTPRHDPNDSYYASVAKGFEEDFGWRRPPQLVSKANGPFIFGMHSANAATAVDDSATVINNASQQYSKSGQVSMSNSDSSSASQNSEKDSKLLVKAKNRKTSKKSSKDKKKPTNSSSNNNNKENRPNIKCVVVGDGAVGKTNLIVSYLENRFIREHVPTASDIYNAQVMVNDSPVHVTLCDTAGQDHFDPLRELCYPDSDVFVLCFSVVKPDTFHSIRTKWAPKFSKTKAALILVGTQTDLRGDIHTLNRLQVQGQKPVAFTEAWDFAASIDAKYIETSSFTQEKVKDVFDTAIWEALIPSTLPPTPPLWKKLLCLA